MFNIENLTNKYFLELNAEDVLSIKHLQIEDKIKCFAFFLTSEVITNYSVISNLFMLINGITDIETEISEDERLFFNSLEEYVDIKLELKKEIEEFKKKLLIYYLGVVEGLNVKIPELKIHIPNTYYNILYLTNPTFISKIMNEQLKNIDVNAVKPTFNAESIYDKINNHVYSQTYGIIDRILSEVVDDNFRFM
jgi:hypothetical protein